MSDRQRITDKPGPISSESSGSPFKLPLRMPGWFPDGIDARGGGCQRVYPVETVGLDGLTPLPFPVPFQPGYSSSDGTDPDWWIHGAPISADDKPLTKLVRELAVLVRNYNASLYRLRGFHFYNTYKIWPSKNPDGDPDTSAITSPSDPLYKTMAAAAEKNWAEVNGVLDKFLNTGHYDLKLVAADMVEVNGYIVSMRVVANLLKFKGKVPDTRDMGGSSSHVSISSAFSSAL